MKFKYYIGLGSNIEPKFKFLKKSIDELNHIGKVTKKSAIYESTAWGKENQSNFFNAVIRFHSDLDPFHLLKSIQKIEKNIGRTFNEEKWGPREIDIDIIFADNIYIHKKELNIPHKYFKKRNFVLKPMSELNQNYKPENNENDMLFYLNHSNDNKKVNISIKNW